MGTKKGQKRKTARRAYDFSTRKGTPASRSLYPLKRDKKGTIRTPFGMPLTMKQAEQWLNKFRGRK